MAHDIAGDSRLDPRIKALLAAAPTMPSRDVDSRDALLAEAILRSAPGHRGIPPGDGVVRHRGGRPVDGSHSTPSRSSPSPTATRSTSSSSAPRATTPLPCVYYIHGGGMATMSCYDGMYRAWGRIIAAHGVAVAMVDFRNCRVASSAPEVAPFPAGLNDCVSGLHWVVADATHLRHRPRPDRGGRRERRRQPHPGHRAAPQARRRPRSDQGPLRPVPLHRRSVADPESPSSTENNGILLDLHNNRGAMAYGIEAVRGAEPAGLAGLRHRATTCTGFPPTVISVNECDPLRDEGINFYRLLLAAGVAGAVPAGDGHHPRHGDLPHRLPRHQPRHGPRHRRLRPGVDRPGSVIDARDRTRPDPSATLGDPQGRSNRHCVNMAPMVAVTLADLAYRYRQFLIAVLGAGVVMAMALLMAGLAGGFTVETTNTVGGVGADRWILAVNSGAGSPPSTCSPSPMWVGSPPRRASSGPTPWPCSPRRSSWSVASVRRST